MVKAMSKVEFHFDFGSPNAYRSGSIINNGSVAGHRTGYSVSMVTARSRAEIGRPNHDTDIGMDHGPTSTGQDTRRSPAMLQRQTPLGTPALIWRF
jgi:hypothetical protein